MNEKKSLQEYFGFRIDVYLLWLLSVGALTAGLSLPVITFTQLFKTSTYSILGGVDDLYRHKEYVLAAVIFTFSVLFPIIKHLSLFLLWFLPIDRKNRSAMIARLGEMGRWSMLDVYVLAITVVVAKSSAFFKAVPEVGLYLFGASALLSILTSAWIEKLSKKAT